MFHLEQSIAAWRAQMLAAGIQTPVPLEELEIHMREEIERQKKSGLDEKSAFEISVQQLGPDTSIEKEFSKISSHHVEPLDRNSIRLNILATWFLLAGLSDAALFCYRPNFAPYTEFDPQTGVPISRVQIWFILFGAIQFLIGIGLFQRRTVARICVFAWTLILISGFTQNHFHVYWLPFFHYPAWLYFPAIGGVLSLSASSTFPQIAPYLNLVVLIWGSLFLFRPTAGSLFKNTEKRKI